jgi:Fe-S-cluster-containing hydrogenase component 2
MAYVVQEPCLDCKYGDCAEVCPVECFYQAPDILYINPEECIDCDACAPACPVAAIVPDSEADEEWIQKNANFDFSEETRVTDKSQVEHGPKWDPNLANPD